MILRKPDIRIGVINQYYGICKGLVRTWKHLAGSPSRTKAEGIMDEKIEVLKKGKDPKDKYYEASERISGGIIDENAKQGKCHGKNSEHRQTTG